MEETAVVMNKEYVMGEQTEIPNTEFCAVRRESYTEIQDASGEQIIVLPPQWSLFDIELWCGGYTIGKKQGEANGKKKGREEAKREVLETLGIMKEIGAVNAKINGVARALQAHITAGSRNQKTE